MRDRTGAQARLVYTLRGPAISRGKYVDAGDVPVYAIATTAVAQIGALVMNSSRQCDDAVDEYLRFGARG